MQHNVEDEVYYSDESDYESNEITSVDEGIHSENGEQNVENVAQQEQQQCKWENCNVNCLECGGWYLENNFANTEMELGEMELDIMQGVENQLDQLEQNENGNYLDKEEENGIITPPPEYVPREPNPILGEEAGTNNGSRQVVLSGDRKEEGEMGKMQSFQFNTLIPAELKWTAFDECIQDMVNPELAERMRKIRTGKNDKPEGEIIKEAAMIWAELRYKAMKEKHELEKKDLVEKLKEAEKKVDKYYLKWNTAVVEKERIHNGARQLNTDFINYQQELTLEQARNSTLQGVCRAWRCLCLEKDEEITRMREHNARIERKLEEKTKENRRLKDENDERKQT